MISPFFSIIIPIYNVEDYLKKCLESVLCQTFHDFEVILVDDESSDKSGELADYYSRQDSRFTVIHKKNGGSSEARNEGLIIAKGEYVVFLDSDDYWDDSFALEKINDSLKLKSSDLLLFNCKDFDCLQKKIIARRPDYDLNIFKESKSTILSYLVENNLFPVAAWMLAVRKELLIKNQISFVKGNKAEDIEWLINVFYKANSIDAINETFYIYLKNRPGSVTSKIDEKGIAGILYAITHWKQKLIDESNPLIPFLQYQYLILVMNLHKSNLVSKHYGDLLLHNDLLNPIYSKTLNNKVGSKIISFFGFRVGAMLLFQLHSLRKYF